MSLCNKIEIHYTNINKKTKEASSDVYPVTDATVNGNNLIFSWLVSSNATKYPGSLNFLIRFGCLEDDYNSAFYYCTNLTSITFEGAPVSIGSSAFSNCTKLTVINVPWAEGAVENAPWGATNATINYNYVAG